MRARRLLAKNYRAFAPRHQTVGGPGIGFGPGQNVGGVVRGHAAIDIRPAAGGAQRDRGPGIAGGQAIDLHDFDPFRARARRRWRHKAARPCTGPPPPPEGWLCRSCRYEAVPFTRSFRVNAPRRAMTRQPRRRTPRLPFSLRAGRSPGLRIQGFPTVAPLPSRMASGSDDLSGHGRGGGCALVRLSPRLSHSLFACRKDRHQHRPN